MGYSNKLLTSFLTRFESMLVIMSKKNASFSRVSCILCGVALPIGGKREGKPSLFCMGEAKYWQSAALYVTLGL